MAPFCGTSPTNSHHADFLTLSVTRTENGVAVHLKARVAAPAHPKADRLTLPDGRGATRRKDATDLVRIRLIDGDPGAAR